jgi:hypothetical protein
MGDRAVIDCGKTPIFTVDTAAVIVALIIGNDATLEDGLATSTANAAIP